MSEKSCAYRDREAAIMSCVYEDAEPVERQSFEAHLATCAICRQEVAGLGLVRQHLQRWAPPEPLVSTTAPASPAEGRRRWSALRDIPVWAQAAAAMLLLGVAAGLANLQVTVGREGLSVRTGWSREVPVQSPSAVAVSHEDLRALERSLRTEIESRPVSSTVEVDAKVREEIMQGVRALLARQAQEQQREVSLQAAEVLRTVNAQRLSDNAKMAQILDAKDRAIQFDAWRQQQYVHALAQQVSLQGLK